MQARHHGGHFGTVIPKQVRIAPQKKATGPTPLGYTCDKDVFVLFLVFTPKCEGKIRIKGGFCAPKRDCVLQAKIVPQTKATGPMPLGCIFEEDLCSFFWSSPPEYQGKIRVEGGFCAPKAKIVPQKKATEPTPLTCICDGLFFGLHPRIYFLPHQNFLCPLLPSTLLLRRVCIHE